MIYTKLNNTHFVTPKDNPKDRVEIEVGDSKQPDFYPQVKIQRWDNECNVSIRLKDTEYEKAVVSTDKDKIIWDKGNIKAEFYAIEEGEGGYEFEVILKEKPLTNKIEFTLQDKDVDYFYQPPLTQQEIDEGAFRPENVVGSYAVYAKTPKTNWTDGKLYRTGKVGHIFRPHIIDSAGTEVWGILNIDRGILSVEIPQDFLDKAIYPVIVDPTFGYTTAGASDMVYLASYVDDSSYMNGQAYALGTDGNLDSISAYLRVVAGTSPATLDLFFAIYREDSAEANSHGLVASVEANRSISSAAGWTTINAASELLVADDYIIADLGDGNDLSDQNVYTRGDSISPATMRHYDEASTGVNSYTTRKAENPWTETDTNYTFKISIYATYTAAGAPVVLSKPTLLTLNVG